MLKCNQPYIVPIIIIFLLIIFAYYANKHKKIFIIIVFIGIFIWYIKKNKQIDLSIIMPNNIQNNDIFDLPPYFIEYK